MNKEMLLWELERLLNTGDYNVWRVIKKLKEDVESGKFDSIKIDVK